MPRSVLVLSPHPDLFTAVHSVLGADDRFTDAGSLVHCDGEVALA